MKCAIIAPKCESFEATISDIASDKSISHRAVIFSLLSSGKSQISRFLCAEDTLNSLKIALMLGAKAKINGENLSESSDFSRFVGNFNANIEISTNGAIIEPSDILDCGNAGTAIRLYLGLLSAQNGKYFVLNGDKYLRIRPMKRVIAPLREVGAQIYARQNATLAPITILGQNLDAFNYHSPISSAQVKTALILAGLCGNGGTFSEVSLSRNHSENILREMGANLALENDKITIAPLKNPLNPLNLAIPADPSSAFYFAILALILPKSRVVLQNVLLNKTRIEAFRVLEKMGAKLEITPKISQYEEIGDICISKDSPLKCVEVAENISWLIDEIPALAIVFAFARGKSIIKNAAELRTKESDRIYAVTQNLAQFGIECEEFEDGFSVCGKFGETRESLRDSRESLPQNRVVINSFGDHRIAMSFALLGALCEVEVQDCACIETSFPNFFAILARFVEVKCGEILDDSREGQ